MALLTAVFIHCPAQNGKNYQELLDSLSRSVPSLNQSVSISVTDVSIQEFLRGVASSAGLNINVDPELDTRIINNFSDVMAKDILVFLLDEYNLQLSITGNIISIFKTKPATDPLALARQHITYDSASRIISLDYNTYAISNAVKEITSLTGNNVVLSPGLESAMITCYIQDMPFDNALTMLAFSNGLDMKMTEDDFYLLSKTPDENGENNAGRTYQAGRQAARNAGDLGFITEVYSTDSISVFADDTPIDAVIREVSDKLGIDYFITSPLQGNITLSIEGIDYHTFIEYVLNGTQNTYKLYRGIYVFGAQNRDETREFRVIELQYRSIDSLLTKLPESVKTGLDLKEFPELNSILAGGSTLRLDQFEAFLKEIDNLVPVVQIEVLIVYMNDNYVISTGIDAGLADQPVESAGTVFPELNMQFGAETINDLINSFNGFGSLNIGKVTPNFYLSLEALENQGLIDISSTPKLSTLNGNEATLSIGSTEYYIEERTDIYGTQNPQLTTTKSYKPVTAELSISIRPIVTGENQIILDISVSQSDFTSRITDEAPPGTMSRDFKSMIRVKDQEMILLGGLEEKKESKTARGVPILSRIPVLKWIFSSRTEENAFTRLNVFIKPTIIN